MHDLDPHVAAYLNALGRRLRRAQLVVLATLGIAVVALARAI